MIKKIIFNFVRRYRHTPASRWAILVIDLFTLAVAFAITDLFRLRMSEYIDWPSLLIKFVAFAILATLFYLIIGTYRSIIRHSGMYDIYKVLISNIAAATVLINNHPIVTNRFTPAYSEILMTFALQIVNMITVRLLLQRVYNDYLRRHRPVRNVVIYGAGSAGTIAYNALAQDPNHDYKVVAYIDDARQKKDAALNGIHIMERKAVLNPAFIKKNNISVLIIAIPSIRLSYKQEITNEALDLGLNVKSVPHISKWINASFTVSQIQDIKIEDLLERESIKLDNVKAYEAMTPRVVCSVAPESMTLKEYFEADEFEHHSRIPVYAESLEYITGYILRDDALEDLAEDKFSKTLKELRRDISFFNEEASLADIWEKLLKSREQMALIIDDYGCFEGILTLEDIIETIFGLEIMDEMDEVSDMQEYAKERWKKRQKRYKKVSIPVPEKNEG